MKREAPSHSKMKRLCRLLDLPLYQAVGLLELLWHLTAKEAPRGNIGKLSNEDIALALDYRHDEDALIESLVRTRWLDASAEHRLLVHDWHEHADEAVKKRLTRSGQTFLSSRHVETKPLSVETEPQNGTLPRAGAGPVPEPEPEPVPVPVLKKNNNPMSDDIASAAVVVDDKDKNSSAPKRALRKEQREAVERLFAYYLAGTERHPKMYELTPARMDKGLARLADCQRKCGGDLGKAEKLMGMAIDALLASDFHAGKNDQHMKYTDWINHLFKSTEKLEFWLAR